MFKHICACFCSYDNCVITENIVFDGFIVCLLCVVVCCVLFYFIFSNNELSNVSACVCHSAEVYRDDRASLFYHSGAISKLQTDIIVYIFVCIMIVMLISVFGCCVG